ncbi:DUF1678 family protein [Methanopyrus kandleri]|uniref:Uncharacterized protein specific for M.kandleri, MK-1 family n=2 Tax=Methanopyrus kandleri TaxID=2320 RepID=Q8TXS6_METKA|nr:DUF1678 family protein [Methanopyrus kandleri]AAM01799.1 Uncharacterized protein specific for M.kandleri, MK-1 family [Methanopyrus kandleri AV19]HII70195.1 DUF1678 family protein [Methanopyrus kandleri]
MNVRPGGPPVLDPVRLGVPMEVPEDPVELVRVFRVLVETLERGTLPFLGASYRSVNGKVYGPYYEARWKPRKGERGRTIYLGREDNESVQFLREWLETIRLAAPRLSEHRKAKWFVARAVRRALVPVLRQLAQMSAEHRAEVLQKLEEIVKEGVSRTCSILRSVEFNPLRRLGWPGSGKEIIDSVLRGLPGTVRDILVDVLAPWPAWYSLRIVRLWRGEREARRYWRERVGLYDRVKQREAA